MVTFILVLSLLLQLLAIYFALSLIRLTGRSLAWGLIAGAIALMALRRGTSLAEVLLLGHTARVDLITELIALAISSLMVIGIAQVLPIFKEIHAISGRLRESEEKYRSVVDAMAEGLVLEDAEGRIIAVNPAAENILGRKAEELIGMTSDDPSWQAIYEDHTSFQGDAHPISVSRNTGESQRNIVMGIRQPHGDLRWISINSGPILDSNTGKPKAAVVTFQDITERLHAEKEWEDLQQHLQQTQKMESIGRLAGGVAHDFNNMLGAIIGFTELAQRHVSPEQKVLSKYLQEIYNAAQHSAGLTRQLLTFARKQTTIPKVIDPNESVEVMQKMLQRLISEEVTLTWLPGKDVWPVMIDPSQLDQILTNLCVNARDAINGAGNISIATANESFDLKHHKAKPGDYVRLSVSDNGNGMDMDTVTKIFEPFYTTKGIGEGTGLGLSTVYGIVEQNKGFIEVDSEPGRGTVFNIYLPRHYGGSKPQFAEAKATFVRGHERILLVEDEAAILEVAKLALEACGYTVLTAQSPEEAMRIAQNDADEIDLLITDIIMPGINGRDLAKSLSSTHPRMHCLYMSGYSGNAISDQGILDEDLHFIQKPFTIVGLTTKVREVLDQ